TMRKQEQTNPAEEHHPNGRRFRRRGYRAEQPVIFDLPAARDARSKEQRGRWTSISAIPERQAPQAFDRDWSAAGKRQSAEEHVRDRGVECIDRTISKIAYQQVVAERPKFRRRDGQAPGRVQGAV